MAETWSKTDNSMEPEKAAMRVKYLPENARVLDCFCGLGGMYYGAYKNRVAFYHGLDKNKVHSNELCTLMPNSRYVVSHDLAEFNTFDLDDWGCPWKLFYSIVKKIKSGEYTFFITDGLVCHQKMTGVVSGFVSATERIPRGMTVYGVNRWYPDIFATMLLDVCRRYGCTVSIASYFHNQKRTVFYWAIKIKKA